jgi:hypothetical protein
MILGQSPIAGLYGLGDARSDVVSLLAVILGRQKAESTIASFETVVRTKAAEGTTAAIDAKIPGILSQVRTEVDKQTKPIFLGAIGVGGLAALVGVAAIVRARRCRRA